MKAEGEWTPTETNYKMQGIDGRVRTLNSMSAEINSKTKEMRFDADELIKLEQSAIASELGLDPRQIPIILLLASEGPRFTEKTKGTVAQRYRMNKMLFYYWKELSKNGFETSFIHDEFLSKKRGPVPAHLDELAKDLASKGLIELTIGGKKEKRPWEYSLTMNGWATLDNLWAATPEVCKSSIKKVKEELYLLDTTQMMHKVHNEYPEYRATYTELDEE